MVWPYIRWVDKDNRADLGEIVFTVPQLIRMLQSCNLAQCYRRHIMVHVSFQIRGGHKLVTLTGEGTHPRTGGAPTGERTSRGILAVAAQTATS